MNRPADAPAHRNAPVVSVPVVSRSPDGDTPATEGLPRVSRYLRDQASPARPAAHQAHGRSFGVRTANTPLRNHPPLGREHTLHQHNGPGTNRPPPLPAGRFRNNSFTPATASHARTGPSLPTSYMCNTEKTPRTPPPCRVLLHSRPLNHLPFTNTGTAGAHPTPTQRTTDDGQRTPTTSKTRKGKKRAPKGQEARPERARNAGGIC